MLYAAGEPSAVPWSFVHRWNGRAWEDVSIGLPTDRERHVVMRRLDFSNGPKLVIFGPHFSASGYWLHYWNGAEWVPEPSGMINNGAPLVVYDDGSGEAVYGVVEVPGFCCRRAVARWDGGQWQTVAATDLFIHQMTVLDLGTGPELYVGGDFTYVGTSSARRIVRWNGSVWAPLGSGINRSPRDILVHDFGGGPALYVADVTEAGGQPVNRIAKWDGQSWSDVGGGGISSIPITTIHTLASFDDGRGPALYAAGFLTYTGTGIPLRGIARFDGTNWDDVGGGVGFGLGNVFPRAMAVYDDGRGPSLFIGSVTQAGGGAPGSIDGIAQLVGCHNQCYADCNNDQRLTVDDFICFIDKFTYGDPYVDCNQDGIRDLQDFMCFIARFTENCR
jgi:trimeric autotransporter adhesin